MEHHALDLRDGEAVRGLLAQARPTVVFHLAAQARERHAAPPKGVLMTEHEEALSLLRQIERNQQRGLALQAEQLALVRDQMARTEARVQESIALQKVAVAKQSKALNVLMPIIVVALVYVGYLMFRHG